MPTEHLLHNIDKRLAVLEALTKEHTASADQNFKSLRSDSEMIRLELAKLKVRVATVAGGISVGVALIAQFWR